MNEHKCLTTLTIMYILSVVVTAESSTEVYHDTGVQTVKYLMSVEERKEVEQEILTMFGVPKKPRKIPKNLNGSAPQFLFDVYKSLQDESLHDRKTRSVSDVGLYDERDVQNSDVIVTLYLSNHSLISNVQTTHELGKHILFALNDVPPEETHMITSAEVHLYQSGNSNSIKKYSVTLYQVISTESEEKKLKFVATQNTTTDYDGWLRFNATGALVSWIHFLYQNQGFYVSVHLLDNEGCEVNPEEIGMVTLADQLNEAKKPFMAVYLKSKNGGNIVGGPSLQKLYRRRRRKTIESSFNANPFQNIEDKFQPGSCQLKTLYVKFKELEWQDWIIAPDGYGAFYCSGECNFPLNAHMNATNHAIMQTLVHTREPWKAPKSCCAPIKMAQQAVLFFLEDNNVILKKYKNMIVKSCGCH